MYDTIPTGKQPITLLLKGPPGAGKTHKAAYFPKPVLFNFDNNLSALRKLPKEVSAGIKIVHPRMKDGKPVKPHLIWNNFIEQLAKVSEDAEVRTIIIDSLTTMSEILMDKILNTGDPAKKVEIQNWGDFSRYMKWLGEELLCASDLDKNVIFIAHENIVVDKKTDEVKYVLNLGGAMKNSFDLYFTDCWRVWVRSTGQKVIYWVRTLPTEQHNAKSSLDLPSDFIWDDNKDLVLSLIK